MQTNESRQRLKYLRIGAVFGSDRNKTLSFCSIRTQNRSQILRTAQFKGLVWFADFLFRSLRSECGSVVVLFSSRFISRIENHRNNWMQFRRTNRRIEENKKIIACDTFERGAIDERTISCWNKSEIDFYWILFDATHLNYLLQFFVFVRCVCCAVLRCTLTIRVHRHQRTRNAKRNKTDNKKKEEK